MYCRHLMGEDLETLNLKELQQLEQQLESSLKHIRSRKVVNDTSRKESYWCNHVYLKVQHLIGSYTLSYTVYVQKLTSINSLYVQSQLMLESISELQSKVNRRSLAVRTCCSSNLETLVWFFSCPSDGHRFLQTLSCDFVLTSMQVFLLLCWYVLRYCCRRGHCKRKTRFYRRR